MCLRTKGPIPSLQKKLFSMLWNILYALLLLERHPFGSQDLSARLDYSGWVKLNTDSSSLSNPGIAGGGASDP